MTVNDIKWIHVEPSSKCNAWCPACSRNNHGYGLSEGLVEQDLSPDRFSEIISEFPNIHAVQLCGNFGDPMASAYINEIIDISLSHSEKIQIHTNGSLRTKKWWAELGNRLSGINHDVWFGIDGIGETHEIYRQGTIFDKIMENAQAFIGAGGHATWQFIPYAHNEHQIKDCLKLSQKMKFKNFKMAKLYRNQKLARNWKTGVEFSLLPPSERIQPIIRMPKEFTVVEKNNCMHLTQPSIYITASGKISWCCYFGNIKQFDSVAEVFHQDCDLTHQNCLNNCGL
jgi:hypothetical protein